MQSNYPDLSAAVAGNRKFDVYMGMDVFGRKTFGGGQWNVGTLILITSSIGQGYRVSVEGNQLTDAPWNNMSCQGFQLWPPQLMHVKSKGGLAAVMNKRIRALVCTIRNARIVSQIQWSDYATSS
ncbi:hypothetical protein NC653_020579 [Populus alba x Populus x berolinensis]|uniref:Uncharacterized protein n=1 Tax=Populus alba x Populus x berolinensis TaxID=444605 RepID=A0AAD6QCL5_9ROSI|nr:hypothetical protein NC653_020579 [Populus alba x Populus x berolinensis]